MIADTIEREREREEESMYKMRKGGEEMGVGSGIMDLGGMPPTCSYVC